MILQLNNSKKPGDRICKLQCDICGRVYLKTYVLAVRAKHHFCSLVCRCEWEIDITHHPAWKGGEVKMLGYIFIKTIGHPYGNEYSYVKRSRLVMEQAIGRYLIPEETIHHINQIRDDDRLENLMLFSTKSEHMRIKHIRKSSKLNQLVLNTA